MPPARRAVESGQLNYYILRHHREPRPTMLPAALYLTARYKARREARRNTILSFVVLFGVIIIPIVIAYGISRIH